MLRMIRTAFPPTDLGDGDSGDVDHQPPRSLSR